MRIRILRTGIFQAGKIQFFFLQANLQLVRFDLLAFIWPHVQSEDVIFSKAESRSELLVTFLFVSDPALVTVTDSLSIIAEIQSLPQGLLSTKRVLVHIMAVFFEPNAVNVTLVMWGIHRFTVGYLEEKMKDEKCDHVQSGCVSH